MEKDTDISERLKQVIDFHSLSINKFAKTLGYERSQAIYDMINGKAKPSFDFFEKFINSEYSASISIKWLLTGKGEMLKTENKDGPPDPVRVQTVPELQQMIIDLQNREINRLQQEIDELKKEQPLPADHPKPTHSDQ